MLLLVLILIFNPLYIYSVDQKTQNAQTNQAHDKEQEDIKKLIEKYVRLIHTKDAYKKAFQENINEKNFELINKKRIELEDGFDNFIKELINKELAINFMTIESLKSFIKYLLEDEIVFITFQKYEVLHQIFLQINKITN